MLFCSSVAHETQHNPWEIPGDWVVYNVFLAGITLAMSPQSNSDNVWLSFALKSRSRN